MLVSTRLQTAKGADDSSYRDVLAIPNEALAVFFSKCIREGSTPNIWNLTLLVAVPKAKGPFDNADNVRMIALECCVLKLLTTVIDARIRAFCDAKDILPRSLNGFRPGYRTENNAFILRVATEAAHRNGKPLYTAFIDLKNAFPSVNRDILWAKMSALGVRGPLITWLRTLYRDMRYRLTMDGLISDEMQSDLGILMGDPASPLAFLLYISDFETTPHEDDVLLDGCTVSHLEHADDMVLFSTSESGLQTKLDDLALWASLNQMQINVDKTVVMVFPRPYARLQLAQPQVTLYGRELGVTTKQTYVGVVFSSGSGNAWDEHTSACEKRARLAASKILFIESHVGSLPPWEGRMLYRSQVDPHLTWACEVAGVGTVKQVDQLAAVQHYFLRRLLGLQSRSQLCVLYSELDIWPLKYRRLELQLRYLHHVLSLQPTHLAHVALRESLSIARDRARSWFAQLRATAVDMGLALQETPLPSDVDACLKELSNRVRERVHADVCASEKLDLLRARRDFSNGRPRAAPTLAFRAYLRIGSADLRVAVTRILLSEHSLSIERLRWRDGRNYDIPRRARLCRFCRSEVEEPLHCLFSCKASPDLVRHHVTFWSAVSRGLPPTLSLASIRALDREEMFHVLLDAPETRDHLASLCFQVLELYGRTERFVPSQDEVLTIIGHDD